jgi:hypothetical protein
MNAKKAKQIRRWMRQMMSVSYRDREYITVNARASNPRTKAKWKNGIAPLIRLEPNCPRAIYKRLKQVHA